MISKTISRFIASLFLLTFCYQNGGQEFLAAIHVLSAYQVESQMETPVAENEIEVEEKEVEGMLLHSRLSELTDLEHKKTICLEEFPRNLVWLKKPTPPPKG